MKGKPKYKYGQEVRFIWYGEEKTGTIAIIDRYGTFFDDEDVSYDIISEDCLYKHVKEVHIESLDLTKAAIEEARSLQKAYSEGKLVPEPVDLTSVESMLKSFGVKKEETN